MKEPSPSIIYKHGATPVTLARCVCNDSVHEFQSPFSAEASGAYSQTIVLLVQLAKLKKNVKIKNDNLKCHK